jgi:hypothetical protein
MMSLLLLLYLLLTTVKLKKLTQKIFSKVEKCIGFKNTSILERLILHSRTEKCVSFKNTSILEDHSRF